MEAVQHIGIIRLLALQRPRHLPSSTPSSSSATSIKLSMEGKKVPCRHADDLNCEKTFTMERNEAAHVKAVHDNVTYPCRRAEDLHCTQTFRSKAYEAAHVKRVHHNERYPCRHADDLNCEKTFTTKRNEATHVKRVHHNVTYPCRRAGDLHCKQTFRSKANAIAHAKRVHDRVRYPCRYSVEHQCNKTFGSSSDESKHAKNVHEGVRYPCPHAEDLGCEAKFVSKGKAKVHAESVHDKRRWPCPHAEQLSCDMTFSTKHNAANHAQDIHDNEKKWPCPFAEVAGCIRRFHKERWATNHAIKVHGNNDPSSFLKGSDGYPCPYKSQLHCGVTFSSNRNARRHARRAHEESQTKWPCPLGDEKGCTLKFVSEHVARRHAETAHGDKSTPKSVPCPRATDENCSKLFRTRGAAKDHAVAVHGKFHPDETFIAAWPRISLDIPLKDVDGKTIPGWDKLPRVLRVDDKWTCPDPGCTKTYPKKLDMERHYLSIHLGARWPCEHAESHNCDGTFSSVYDAKKHADTHIAKPRWVCQYLRCLSQMQGRQQLIQGALYHYNVHLRRGDFQKGECKPLKVFNSLSDGDTEAPGDGYQGSEAEDNEVANPDDEEDGGGRDLGSESEDEADEADDAEDGEDEEGEKDGDHSSEPEYDEVENSEYLEPTGESAVAWLGSPGKNQKILREIAQSEGLRHLGLKCPGPERVVNGLVMGTQVCPHSAIITFETGVFYRNRAKDHIGLKNRCAPCNGRFMFNEFLRYHSLGKDAEQGFCSNKHCVNSPWEGAKLCKKHLLRWEPDRPSEDKLKVLRSLFAKAASVQWYPESNIMAELMTRMESDSKAKIPASEFVNIDLECTFQTGEVLQIGLADLEEAKVLDCLTIYSEGIIVPSSSPRAVPLRPRQREYEKKVRGYFTQDGKLDAKKVVGKLQEAGISNKTMFLSWALRCFDLSLLRNWLEQEGFDDVLPGDDNVCLVLNEFRANVKRVIGTTCYNGKRFPLNLPTAFLVLFGENHPLSGRNHHALVDARQLALMARAFIELCKPPEKRVHYPGWGVMTLGSAKRQRSMEEYFPPGPNKKAKLP